MKLLISTISILIFFWNTNVESPNSKKNRINQPTNTALEKNWNKGFNGLWINEDDQTGNITKCNIRYDNNQFHVQIWGACVPIDCEWGERASDEVEKETNIFNLFWDHGFAERSFTFEMIDGRLKVTEKSEYKDNSGREDYELVEYFVKQ